MFIQYDGTNYKGWQVQPNPKIVTIQGTLEKAIFKIINQPCKLIAAGRTDAGVHALCQVASFKTTAKLQLKDLHRALNAILPHDIRIQEVVEKDLGFHPRFDAKSKIYSYVISNFKTVPPFLDRYTWNINQNLDIEAMTVSLKSLVGEHDFSSFKSSGCTSKNPLRTIFSASLETAERVNFLSFFFIGNFIKISIEANAFLRHMVRNIIGTLIEIGRKKIQPTDIEIILKGKDRRRAGITAPAKGLYLEKINY
ncbi:MAG: tRNA pseudouridine(38-40) synthase TruA [Thermodesulfovibrionales bacterium]|nr:tRNA pseudouridine(38-40) synthase TruA [Thermodesulfovibrionales bacterium]